MVRRRHRSLPARGRAVVSTDLHGNLEDLHRLRAIWERLSAEDEETYWVLLGDLVHGPDDDSRHRSPELYGYEDRSAEVALEVADLCEAHPDRVLFVLGNHDHAHIGGPVTRKFHHDEPAHLEARMSPEERERMRAFFADALLLVTTPCGAALAHGAPAACIHTPSDLDDIALPCRADWERSMVLALTTAYGQSREVTQRFLAAASREGLEQTLVIHGHDRDDEGWFVEADNQACPVIFGALREHKRYVLLDLGARYESVHALREGHEVRRLFG
jgi:hypothetical protein